MTSTIKGIGAGLLVGACLGMVAAPKKKPSKRKMGKAVKAVGQVLEDLSNTMPF